MMRRTKKRPRAKSDYGEFEFEFEKTLSGLYENEGRNETSRASDGGFAYPDRKRTER